MQVLFVYPVVILPRAILALLATACDIIIIFLIHFLMTKIYKDKLWAINLNFVKILLVILFGIILVVLGEKIALTFGIWNYTSSMPVIPIIQVGLNPILQLGIFPLVILYFASRNVTRQVR